MTDQSYHYATIARALREIDAAGPGLSLEDLAARIGLSPAHFPAVFGPKGNQPLDVSAVKVKFRQLAGEIAAATGSSACVTARPITRTSAPDATASAGVAGRA